MEPKAKKLDPKMIIIAIVAVIVLIVGIVVVAKVAGDSPKKAVARLETAINEKDLDKFTDCLISKQAKDVKEVIKNYEDAGLDVKDLESEFFGSFAEDKDGEEFDVDDLKVKLKVNKVTDKKKDSAKAKVTMEIYNGKDKVNSEDFTVKLKKEDKKWKIDFESLDTDE